MPCPQTCRGGAIVACGRVVLDCAAHGAVCSVEPDGLAVCVHPGGAGGPYPRRCARDLPGVETRCYADDPAIPQATDGSRRRKADVAGVVIHTVTAHPYQPPVLPGSRPSEHAERLARYRQHREGSVVALHGGHRRDRGAVRRPGPVDVLARWRRQPVDGGESSFARAPGELYEVQMRALVALVEHLCAFGIARRYPTQAATGARHRVAHPAADGQRAAVVGCSATANQTAEKPTATPATRPSSPSRRLASWACPSPDTLRPATLTGAHCGGVMTAPGERSRGPLPVVGRSDAEATAHAVDEHPRPVNQRVRAAMHRA